MIIGAEKGKGPRKMILLTVECTAVKGDETAG